MNPLQGGGSSAGISLQGGGLSGLQNTSTLQTTRNPQASVATAGMVQPSANSNNPLVAQGQAQVASNQQFISSQQNQLAALDRQIQQLIQAQAPGVAPTLDINAIRSSAQAAANNQVNPLYTQQLNEYLQNEAASKAEQEQQNQLSIRNAQEQLSNTLAQNTQAEQYAGQQNAAQQENINAQASNYQLNSGNAQEQKLTALRNSLGSGGLAGSGLGSQQLWMAENQKNVEDAQQQGQFQYNRNVANMATQNTFAELAQSSSFANTQEKSQEAQANFSLNSYLRQQSYAEQKAQEALQQWKQQALTAAIQNNMANTISQQLQGMNLSDKNMAAAQARYGGYLGTSSMPELANLSSYAV